MDYVFITRNGDLERIKQLASSYSDLSDAMLISRFNSAARPGITGIHAQAITLVALHREFIKRFGKSPVTISPQNVISLNNAKLVATKSSYEELPVIWVACRDGSSKYIYLDHVIELTKPYINPSALLQEGSVLLIACKHQYPTTMVDLGSDRPFYVSLFNEEGYLMGATHSSKEYSGIFQLITSRRNIIISQEEWILNPVVTNYFYFPMDKKRVTEYI